MKLPFFSFGKSRKPAPAAKVNMMERMAAIAQLARQREFNAATVDRLVSEWTWDSGFSNTEVLGALATVRARSRDLAKNSPIYARFLGLFRENVVGDGFRYKALPYLKSGDPTVIDRETSNFLEYHWWRWASSPYLASSACEMNFTQILSLAAENWARDGEAFILIDRSAQNRYGIALRVIRPECIDEKYNSNTADKYIRGGVEMDRETGRAVAYWFDADRADPCAVFALGKPRFRIPAANIVHIFERHDAEQARGMPVGYAALKYIKMLDEYNKAELVAAKDEACTIGFFHAPIGQDGAMEVDDTTASAMKNAVEAGEKMILPNGWDYSSNTPQHPNREWGSYNVNLQRLISIGLGVDFAELTGNGTDTISAVARRSMLRTREMWKDRQRVMIDTAVDRIFYAWLRSFLSLQISGKLTPADFDRLEDHTFQGRRWGWIDPAAEVNAAVVCAAHGWRTDAEIAAEYGNDIDDSIAEQLRIKNIKDAAGLITIGNGLGSQAADSQPATTESVTAIEDAAADTDETPSEPNAEPAPVDRATNKPKRKRTAKKEKSNNGK